MVNIWKFINFKLCSPIKTLSILWMYHNLPIVACISMFLAQCLVSNHLTSLFPDMLNNCNFQYQNVHMKSIVTYRFNFSLSQFFTCDLIDKIFKFSTSLLFPFMTNIFNILIPFITLTFSASQ